MTIFVSIAAYRDPELVPTIEDCLRKARWPDDLRFGICWQHGAGEPAPPDLGQRMRLLDIPWQESQGACWARAEIMKLYAGEDWFLQLDSHHRFVQDWDAKLLQQVEWSGAARPIIGSFGAMFDPANPDPDTAQRRGIALHAFGQDGVPVMHGYSIPEWADRRRPIRARFLAAGSLFTLGRFVEDVPYDPALYFLGEEITLAVRAFTHGYDMFHPSDHIIWHEILGSQRNRHWDDHLPSSDVKTSWQVRDTASRAKVAQFLRTPHQGPLGCGAVRSAAEYEAWAGLNFRRRYASPAARRGDEPPPAPPPTEPARTWKVRLVLDRAALPAAAFDRPRFWYVGFHDDNAVEIAREDVQPAELQRSLAMAAESIVIERHFPSTRPPRSWMVWPTDRHGRWLDHVTGTVDAECLA